MKIKIIITGNVQSVGMRDFIKNNASRLKITGYVRNLVGGIVEAVFIGEENEVYKMIRVVRRGPIGAVVNDVVISPWKGEDFDNFTIKYEER